MKYIENRVNLKLRKRQEYRIKMILILKYNRGARGYISLFPLLSRVEAKGS